MSNESFDFWLPKESNKTNDSDAYLKLAFSNIASMSPENVESVVNNLINTGFIYHAARCLEISAQYKLGVFFTGNELLSYRYPDFGFFHRNIKFLIDAGCLYIKGNRKKTAKLAFQRALTFVEEALRQIKEYESESTKDLLCLGLAFELAGHCCFPTNNKDGLDYYEAAKNYWQRSFEIDPEESESWKTHTVTKTVLSCLKEVAKIKVEEETTLIPLLSTDFETRINKAKNLLLAS